MAKNIIHEHTHKKIRVNLGNLRINKFFYLCCLRKSRYHVLAIDTYYFLQCKLQPGLYHLCLFFLLLKKYQSTKELPQTFSQVYSINTKRNKVYPFDCSNIYFLHPPIPTCIFKLSREQAKKYVGR